MYCLTWTRCIHSAVGWEAVVMAGVLLGSLRDYPDGGSIVTNFLYFFQEATWQLAKLRACAYSPIVSNDLQILEVHGPDLQPHLDGLGRLRIAVFRDYPYLYDGTLEYEREYLQSYLKSPAQLGGARAGSRRDRGRDHLHAHDRRGDLSFKPPL